MSLNDDKFSDDLIMNKQQFNINGIIILKNAFENVYYMLAIVSQGQ